MNGTWLYEEDEHSWQLFFLPVNGVMPVQIIKAAKKNTPYAEYWPSPKEAAFILKALNEASK